MTLQAATLEIPDHELLRRVGQGSYGEVWLARNVMGTFRAVKIIRRVTFDHDRPYEREFEGIRQFEPISRQHPGLTAILHIGRGEGFFYYVMEVADDLDGGTLIDPERFAARTLAAELKRNRRLPVQECARLGHILAEALAYLHGQGLVHRDIKPSNIIFVNGLPKLADVGLVAGAGERESFVGTMGYVPPEGPGRVTADIFSLGKVLYEIAMGKDREEFPELPTSLRDLPEAPALLKLNTLLTKACHPDPRRRFTSAEEMGRALARLAGQLKDRLTTSSDTVDYGTDRTRAVVLNTAGDTTGDSLVQRLSERLSNTGIRVFIDSQRQITAHGARELERQIEQAHLILAILSEASIKSELVAYGLGLAMQSLRRLESQPKIVLLRCNWTGTLPRLAVLLSEKDAVMEWNSPNDDEQVINGLLARFSKPEEKR